MEGKQAAPKLTVALAGNPNAGKTTVFNALCGERQHVGNYPGVTVEKKIGRAEHRDVEITIVDLPGTYSLTAYSVEEVLARDYLLNERPDLVVHVVDASNLERNLYLAVQLMELGMPLVLDFNMADVAKAQGLEMDLERLSSHLGVPIVTTVGSKGQGIQELLDAIVDVGKGSLPSAPAQVKYGREVEKELGKLTPLVNQAEPILAERYGARWVALKLLEADQQAAEEVQSEEVHSAARNSISHLSVIFGDSPEMVVAERRYGFISGICQETVLSTTEIRHTRSDQIDEVMTHKVLGLPIFLGVMYLVFFLTFRVGEPGMALIEQFFGWMSNGILSIWPNEALPWLRSLLVDGVIGGVGGVLIFLPNILLLFLAIALLEDSGYMARAAFIMDRYMHKMGLHGKSFIPMLLGFGCSVPAIMATRTLESRRDRLTTMMIVPLMSCSARITIYSLFIPAFFPVSWRAPVLWIIYLVGVALAVFSAWLLRKTIFRGETTPLAMELPPYRVPTAKGALIHMWERGWLYVKKAGTVILGASIVLWFLASFPVKVEEAATSNQAAERAKSTFFSRVEQIGAQTGIPDGKTQLLKMAQAEADASKEGQDGGEKEAVESALEDLGRKDRDPILHALLEAREVALTIRKNRSEKGGKTTVKEAPLGIVDPSLYGTAILFLDEAETPYLKEVRRIQAERDAERISYTWAGRIGKGLGVVLKPLGFDWKISTALIGALAAKELFVAQLAIVYAVGDQDADTDQLRSRLREQYTPLVALCVMLFCLISTPCIATLAATRMESGSWKWAGLQLAGLTLLAYGVTLVVYQVGAFLGWGTTPV